MREIYHPQRGADALGGAVLETDHGIDGNVALAAIDGVNDVGIFLVDDASADLAGAGQFAVVGIEFLVGSRNLEMRCAGGSVALTVSTSLRSSA